MLRPAILVALFLSACNGPSSPTKPGDPDRPCRDTADCTAGEVCIHNLCTDAPTGGDTAEAIAHLTASPSQLSFGTVAPGGKRRLSVVLLNDGQRVVTITRAQIEPATAPFRIESMGTGPFWIRPGRSRAIFATYAPVEAGSRVAELVIESQAPILRVALLGQ